MPRRPEPARTPTPAPSVPVDATGRADPTPVRCAFCGHAVPPSVAPVQRDGRRFCSATCGQAAAAGAEPFAGRVDRRYRLGVDALAVGLPGGVPRNAAVLLAGEEGTRLQGLLQECVWRALEGGDPAVVVSIDRPPHSLVDSFLGHGWNVLPHLERESLVVVDLFTERLHDESAVTGRATRWNRHLLSALEGAVRAVRDPSDVYEIANQVDGAVEEAGLSDAGIVAVDYLTELAAVAQETRAANLLRELRAFVPKSRSVPLLAGASVGRFEDLYRTDFPHDHEYLFDGIVDLEIREPDDGAEPGAGGGSDRHRCLSVRKMDDAPAVSRWVPYDFVPGAGFVTLDDGLPGAPHPPAAARRPPRVPHGSPPTSR